MVPAVLMRGCALHAWDFMHGKSLPSAETLAAARSSSRDARLDASIARMLLSRAVGLVR